MLGIFKLSVAVLAAVGVAHPGDSHDAHHLKREIVARDHAAKMAARSLGACANSETARALKQRSVVRRAEKVKSLRNERGIKTPSKRYRRDLADLEAWEEVNHNMTGVAKFDMFTPLETVFDANTSCILSPEVTDGPYYVVGEFLRSNVREVKYSAGVDLFLEIQYINVENCEPVPAVAVDIWNANATGTYSGISTSGNYAANGLNSTYLRGIQLTDHDGVAQFETIFPGHYEGRASHTHLLAHTNATVQPNGTISVWDAPVAHIGQLFWPEALRSAVEAVYPYTTNTQPVTSNANDMWSIVQADASFDPFPHFVYLGEDVADGLFAWIQIGINASADYSADNYYSVAAYLDADGGHAVANGTGGGGGGAVGGNGTLGTMNGTMPSGELGRPEEVAMMGQTCAETRHHLRNMD
ncbi:aromatic compound dioxygenase [Parathielavia appendiculata]|uniref:Aromatic compound dioxygenase n=1 Tax=Parathielavia appendiculata TaxID=2587402 RepID=A0AAN6Z3L5_9PEZI|nr:aromatic compound dioxygenase [Parathielavia appendiculata]